MSVGIIYGRAHSGKSDICIEQITAKLAQNCGKPLVLIVPEQFSYAAEHRLTAAIGAIGASSVEVLTFSRLAHRIFATHQGTLRKTISPAGKNMIVYRALHKQKSKLSIFASSGEKAGFIDKIAGLISEFKRYGISHEQLKAQAQCAQTALLRQKLSDLSTVYECYDKIILDGYTDSEDNLYFAATLLLESGYLDGAYIWIDEFSDFLPQHYTMIEALSTKAGEIKVCLCSDDERDADGYFAPAAQTFVKLQNMCIRGNVVIDPPLYLGSSHIKSAELAHLEQHFIDYSMPAYENATHDIELFEATNVFTEIEQCARKILSLVRDEGYRFRDIAVAVGNMDVYAPFANVMFAQYEIPCFVAQKPAASSHPLVLMLGSVLNICIKNWNYDSVFAYLKSGFSGISVREIDLLENYVLAAGIRGKHWLQIGDWSFRAGISDTDQIAAEKLQEIDAIRRRVIAPIVKLREGIGGTKTVSQSCKAVYEFMCELNLFGQISDRVVQFKAEGRLSLANQYSRMWNVVVAILDQMVLIAGEDKMGMESFKNLMMTGFAKQQSGIIPQSVDQVQVSDIPNSRATDSKILFVLGANSGYFPSSSASEGILSDAERTILMQDGIQLAPTARQKVLDERFLIYKSLTKPTQRLYLSYSLSDAEGGALVPSQIIGTIRKLFPKLTVNDDLSQDIQDYKQLINSKTSTFNQLALMLRQKQEGLPMHKVWEDVLLWYEKDDELGAYNKSVKAALKYTNAAKRISAEGMGNLYSGDLYSSVSRLEKFRQCPFSYFVNFALKAKERKTLQLGAPDIGVLMHRVMEIFTRRVADYGKGWSGISDEWCRVSVSDIVDQLTAELFKNSTISNKSAEFLMQRLKDNLIRYVAVMVEHIRRGKFEPIGSEVKFGEGERLSAVDIPLNGKKRLKINGIIDRMDALTTKNGTYYRVVDYKSGKKAFDLGNIYNNLDLQLMVYLDAAVEGMGGKPAGVLYYRIVEPLVRVHGPLAEGENVDGDINRQMKLDGLLLADISILENMDANFDALSDMLPVKLLKDGGFSKTASVATAKQFELLSGYVKDSLKKIGSEILDGKIDIRPYRQKHSCGCDYCNYDGICKFDPSRHDNSYEDMKTISREDVFAALAAQNGGGRHAD